LSRLRRFTENPGNYIKFFGLRQHEVMPNGQPATEQVYIHSKMMVVDDEVAIIGSANINDRSMLGFRDSEIAVVIEDDTKIASTVNGQAVRVAEFAHSLRVECFARIFGMTKAQVRDPLDQKFLLNIEKNAQVRVRDADEHRDLPSSLRLFSGQ
jgi:phospholipase D1/2